ncbi:MAG TPA: SgcJ/EcaC family oxidoreductase [Ilumatobacteraceae bacterium]|nr:SgcJ/EcaC family oxidoreductase [Ilumatobacteraceae bacterium]
MSITEQTDIDVTAIASRLFEHLEEAWNAADGAASGEVFADETEFVNIRGEHFTGNGVTIGRAHQGIFDTIYAGSTMRYAIDVVREITPGSIIAVVTSTLDAPTGPLQGVNQSRITVVITDQTSTEQAGDWRIIAFQNTLVMNIV